MLAHLEAKATRSRVLELEQYRDWYYSDEFAMHAYAIHHMG